MATESPVINNGAMGGCLGGMASGRQPVVDADGDLVRQSDFASQIALAVTYAAEEQVALGASFGGSVPTYFSDIGSGNVTEIASTGSFTDANAFQTLPAAIMILAMASFDNQGVLADTSGQVPESYFAAQANAVSSVFANATVNSQSIGGGFVAGTNFFCTN